MSPAKHELTVRGKMASPEPGAGWYDRILFGDSIAALKTVPENTFHLILSDIPYGISVEEWDVLHDNSNSALLGSSPAQKRAGKVFKSRGKPINGWSEADRAIPRQYYEWCTSWASDWLRVLKPGGSAFVFAGRRYAHRCICAMEDAGFSYRDMVAWMRRSAPHRAQRVSIVFERRGDMVSAGEWDGWRIGNLRPVFEPILWFSKPYRIGTTIADNVLAHGVGAYNEAAFLQYAVQPDNVIGSATSFNTDESGLHPTQKPLQLMRALIELTTKPGHIVLDPFAGSGTTLLAARDTRRHFLGYENNAKYFEICQERLMQPSDSLTRPVGEGAPGGG